MTDTHARARVWTLCLAALVLTALTGPLGGLVAPLAPASAPALHVVAAVLAARVGAATAPVVRRTTGRWHDACHARCR